ncbi:MAG: hydroxyisourate hydrolase [Actinomycetota bacterium]|nr:hydroxyisourate hydrolase [Actinomycetota bacterium]
MSFLSAHVLDASTGTPAAGVEVRLSDEDGTPLAAATTDAGGRVAELGPDTLVPGDYRVAFSVGAYFGRQGQDCFYPVVEVHFTVRATEAHYHIPLLASPFAYTTYRGS